MNRIFRSSLSNRPKANEQKKDACENSIFHRSCLSAGEKQNRNGRTEFLHWLKKPSCSLPFFPKARNILDSGRSSDLPHIQRLPIITVALS